MNSPDIPRPGKGCLAICWQQTQSVCRGPGPRLVLQGEREASACVVPVETGIRIQGRKDFPGVLRSPEMRFPN